MLDPWIIEEILKREKDERQTQEDDRVELPLTPFREDDRPQVVPAVEDQNRGVVTVVE